MNHCQWIVTLENVAAHIHSRRSIFNGAMGHLERLEFGQLFASGDDEWNGATGRHALKAFLAIVSFDEVSTHLRTDTSGQAQVSCVPRHFLTNASYRQRRNTVAIARIGHRGQVANGLVLVHSADVNLHSES